MSQSDSRGDRKASHILIGRACGPDPDDACLQAKVSYYSGPTAKDIEWMEDGLRKTYQNAFGEDAARVGVAVLPYVEEHDGDEE